jgi:hypothetical protein
MISLLTLSGGSALLFCGPKALFMDSVSKRVPHLLRAVIVDPVPVDYLAPVDILDGRDPKVVEQRSWDLSLGGVPPDMSSDSFDTVVVSEEALTVRPGALLSCAWEMLGAGGDFLLYGMSLGSDVAQEAAHLMDGSSAVLSFNYQGEASTARGAWFRKAPQ